jgi:hypothetical protein
VSGSIDPTELLPPGVTTVRKSYTIFYYSGKESDNPHPINGAWIADVQNGQPLGYRQADVYLPESDHATATQLLNSFISPQ